MNELTENAVNPNPVAQFRRWFAAAKLTATPLPEGMTLATVGADGRPSARIVLLKSIDAEGVRFFTNYSSRKSAELTENPHAALLFWWPALERQVRLEGKVQRLSAAQSDAYHQSRPRGSQIGAWASEQSCVVDGRRALEARFAATEAEFKDQAVPRPPHWGGFILNPTSYEFWQGRDNRMHDRLVYERVDGQWKTKRLAP